MIEYACKKCNKILSKKSCPTCQNVDVSKNWKGLAIILDPDNSKIAEKLNIKNVGSYALRVR